jgi:hypothetical protein
VDLSILRWMYLLTSGGIISTISALILSNYVVNGEVRYTAVWGPSNEGEIRVYDGFMTTTGPTMMFCGKRAGVSNCWMYILFEESFDGNSDKIEVLIRFFFPFSL